ncbi:hypothetical protein SeMB42_g07581 [Synchytrium endobioticum]|uniref:L-type lectin-like domain-containing protein n=1 Tax=Synchytrium endobioticum TaxID=286115 RepID=A0A507C045_9FUNG|nr:hypothetical protein SeMB42_g07581 [Synchytrium endobioticum]TPX49086.1 hypothetical protein SeLEV6574_g01678 [Synchytrium endobioticum]
MRPDISTRTPCTVALLATVVALHFTPILGEQLTGQVDLGTKEKPSLLQETIVPLHSFSLHPPYVEENLSNRWWNFGGDAYIDVLSYVRLAPDRQSKQGWLFSRVPFTSASWEIEFEFRIHGHSSSLYGDGFAFWYSTDRESPGPVFGYKDKWTGLGLFFDTYANGRHSHSFPYVYGILNNGTTTYQHDDDGFDQQMGGCSADFRNKDHPTRAKVRYSRHEYLQVQLNVQGLNVWETCFVANNITLPTTAYMGFSAWTGDVSDNHDILRVASSSIINPGSRGAGGFNPSSPNLVHKVFAPVSGSFLMHLYNALFYIVVFLLVLAIAAEFLPAASWQDKSIMQSARVLSLQLCEYLLCTLNALYITR